VQTEFNKITKNVKKTFTIRSKGSDIKIKATTIEDMKSIADEFLQNIIMN
jgi:hypothetical protein